MTKKTIKKCKHSETVKRFVSEDKKHKRQHAQRFDCKEVCSDCGEVVEDEKSRS